MFLKFLEVSKISQKNPENFEKLWEIFESDYAKIDPNDRRPCFIIPLNNKR